LNGKRAYTNLVKTRGGFLRTEVLRDFTGGGGGCCPLPPPGPPLSPAVGSACLFPFSFRFSFVCEKFLFYGVYACTYSSWPFDLSRPRWETAFNARARNNNTNSPTLYFSFRSSLLGQNMHYCFNIPSRFKQLWTTMSLTVL
jgi:hypothetical protein